MADLDRITQQPGMMGGKPCIRGMRITVGVIVGEIGAGRTIPRLPPRASHASIRYSQIANDT